MNEQLWFFVLGQAATAAGIYAAIRADLQEHKFRIGQSERRLDRMEGHNA